MYEKPTIRDQINCIRDLMRRLVEGDYPDEGGSIAIAADFHCAVIIQILAEAESNG